MTARDEGRPWTEAERLAALDRYAILDTPPEPGFDDLARLAADLLEAPIAAVNLIAGNRQWFKAEVGLGVREMPLDNSTCARVMLQPGELVIPDLLEDPRFGCNPLVTAGPGLRFYAGALLETAEGLPLGTLCVLDTRPRPQGLTPRQRFMLKALGRQVMSQLDLRRALAQQERLRSEQARSEALRRQTLNSVTDFAIISTDLQGRVNGWNAGAEKIFGWSEAEMLGQGTDRIFMPEDRQAGAPEARTRQALQKGRAGGERWYLRKDRSRLWGSGEVMPLRDECGAHIGYVKVLHDRTEQRRASEALEALNERYRLAARATSDAIWDWDLQANTVLWNEALETAYGWAPEQVEPTGEWWIAAIHPEDRNRVDRSIHAVIEGTDTSWTEEYRFRRADGSHADVLDRGYVIRDRDGRPLRIIGAMFDLSERKRSEVALRESADQLRLATAAARIGIFDYRVRTNMLIWDDRCRELFGVPPGEPVSYEGTFLAGLHPDDRAMADATVRRALDPVGSGTFAVEYRTIGRADGVERWVAASGEAFFEDGKPARLIGTVLDIGERKQLEERQRALNEELERLVEERTTELRRSEEQLRQSQKMEAVGQLTGGLAHDFNNLLTGIMGSLDLLEIRLTQGRLKDLDRYVLAAQGAAKRAAALTHRLLAFSRQQTLDPRPTDANRLVVGMEELIRRTMGPGIEVEVVTAAGLWPTLVDPNQLENALLNLAINARDAMPDGGRLTIETANSWLDGRAARERDMQPGQYVVICVTDTGTGMAPDVISKAFDPFFTTKPLGQGTGLGLSMIYGFTRQSDGQVRIYSEMGKGTTMRLYLPRYLGKAEETEELPAVAEPSLGGAGETVLIVDDEPTVRMLVVDVLEGLGYAAIEAADSASGLKVLQSDARVDLLVTDVGLPGGMNGRQMADAARVTRPGLKVLFITGYAENAAIGNGHLEAGMHILTKPFAMEALAARIKELISAP